MGLAEARPLLDGQLVTFHHCDKVPLHIYLAEEGLLWLTISKVSAHGWLHCEDLCCDRASPWQGAGDRGHFSPCSNQKAETQTGRAGDKIYLSRPIPRNLLPPAKPRPQWPIQPPTPRWSAIDEGSYSCASHQLGTRTSTHEPSRRLFISNTRVPTPCQCVSHTEDTAVSSATVGKRTGALWWRQGAVMLPRGFT